MIYYIFTILIFLYQDMLQTEDDWNIYHFVEILSFFSMSFFDKIKLGTCNAKQCIYFKKEFLYKSIVMLHGIVFT